MSSSGNLSAVSQSPIEWTISPSSIKIPANSQTTMLNVVAKLKNSYTIKNQPLKKSNSGGQEEDGKSALEGGRQLQRSNTFVEIKQQKTEKYSHLLIGRVKDSQIMFSFFVEATVVESSDKQPMFS